MIDKKQPYFVQLYNLHLSGEIPPTQAEKQALAETVYWHYNFNDLAPLDGNIYPSTGNINVRDGDSQLAPFSITQDNLQYCHPKYTATLLKDTSKKTLKDWWQEDYQSFLNEYKHLRSFVDGYLESEIHRSDVKWLNIAIDNIGRELYFFRNAEPKLILPAIPYYSFIPTGKKFNLKHFTFKSYPKYPVLQTPTKKMFMRVYLELTDLLENSQNIRRCEHKDCNNIFYVNHQSRKYCFGELCQAKRSAESSKKADNQRRETIRKQIAREIVRWLKEKDIKEITVKANCLMKQKGIKTQLRHQKKPKKSLGSYLRGKLMIELLKERGIKLTLQKVGDRNFYHFERVAIP